MIYHNFAIMIWFLAAKVVVDILILSHSKALLRLLRRCGGVMGGPSPGAVSWKLIWCPKMMYYSIMYIYIYLGQEILHHVIIFNDSLRYGMYIYKCTCYKVYIWMLLFWCAYLNILLKPSVNDGILKNTTTSMIANDVTLHFVQNMITSQPVGLPCGLLVLLDWNTKR